MKKLQFDNNTLIKMYYDMVVIRSTESKIAEAYLQGKIGGFCHLYDGQEVIAVSIANLRKEYDSLITGYRCHGMVMSYGVKPYAVFAELLGKADGVSQGKGGSMHMFCPEKGFYGGHGIVGSQISLGTGLAFASKYKQEEAVVFSCIGDGGMNQGQVYESFNMAKVWNLPVVYIIENNVYGMGTKIDRVSPSSDLNKRGLSFDIPSIQIKVEDMDIFKVSQAIHDAREYALKDGPIIIEFKTYRYRGHSMSDPAKYRTKEEVKLMRQYDPIALLHDHLINNNIQSAEELKSIKKEINAIVENDMKLAESAPLADESLLEKDVY